MTLSIIESALDAELYKVIVINHLRRQRADDTAQNNVGIAFVYLKYNDPDRTPKHLFSSLLRQLVEDKDNISDSLLALYKRHCDYKTLLMLDGIVDALKVTITSYQKVYFIIDALDECTEKFDGVWLSSFEDFKTLYKFWSRPDF